MSLTALYIDLKKWITRIEVKCYNTGTRHYINKNSTVNGRKIVSCAAIFLPLTQIWNTNCMEFSLIYHIVSRACVYYNKGLGLWCLMPLSTIFLLYHGSQFCSQKYGIPPAPGHKTESSRDMVKQYVPFLGNKKFQCFH